jgi:hypothetical protein
VTNPSLGGDGRGLLQIVLRIFEARLGLAKLRFGNIDRQKRLALCCVRLIDGRSGLVVLRQRFLEFFLGDGAAIDEFLHTVAFAGGELKIRLGAFERRRGNFDRLFGDFDRLLGLGRGRCQTRHRVFIWRLVDFKQRRAPLDRCVRLDKHSCDSPRLLHLRHDWHDLLKYSNFLRDRMEVLRAEQQREDQARPDRGGDDGDRAREPEKTPFGEHEPECQAIGGGQQPHHGDGLPGGRRSASFRRRVSSAAKRAAMSFNTS